VVCLEKPVEAISPLPAIAQRLPTQSRPVLIHGAEADYKSYGQQVQGEMGGSNIPRGWRQIDPKNSARGFTVKNGFSGSPVLDDLGNLVWGMVVAVAQQGSGVAYALPAENLWAALQSAGADTTVRVPDVTDRQAGAAMATLRAEYEAQHAEPGSETEQMRQELNRLREAVRGLGQEARESADAAATTALEALTAGDKLPAVELLRQKLQQRLAAAGDARHEAAAMAGQLGSMLKLFDSTGALNAFRQAAECDPKDFWTWIEIGRLEQIVGSLDGARKAIDAALLIEAVDERSHSVVLDDRGDVLVAQGNLAAALQSYRDSLAIREGLAQSDPSNAGWQYDLGISHERIGSVLMAQGDESRHEIISRLAKADSGNAGWQRDLSVSHNKIGEVQAAQGDLAAALTSYHASLDIRERLAKADLGNAERQRDLALSYGRVAMVEAQQGLREDALGGFRRGREIISRLARQSPSDATLPNDLAWFDSQIAAQEKRGVA
jgi:tetratricopeptide (TPR) repeat protein